MSNKPSAITQVVAVIVIVAGAWQPAWADHASWKRRDEARFVLLEEHVEQIAAADKKVAQLHVAGGGEAEVAAAVAAKRSAAEAINAIVTDYFCAARIKPAASGDHQGQTRYLENVSLLHEINTLANQCKDAKAADKAAKLAPLIKQFHVSWTAEDKPAEGSEQSPDKEAVAPMKEEGAEENGAEFEISELERSLFNIVNAYRKKQGLEPLRLDERLCYAARDHSSDMSEHNFFSHQSPIPGRSRFTDRADNHGAQAAAENIARDCKDAKMAMSLWVNSEHHRANLTGSHTRIGVGVDAKGLYTQVFGK